MPRRATVSVGTPGLKLPMSPITIASAANRSGCCGGNVLKELPTSSWPSITILIPTGGFPCHAWMAPRCIRMFDFVSAEPAPAAEMLLLGTTDGCANIHAPNERVLLDEFEKAVLAEAEFFGRYAAIAAGA